MRILIIDDENLIRQALNHISILRGHKTRIASTGQEGLLEWDSFEPDLVFLDLILPDQNGFSVIKKAPFSTHIVMMSAYGQYKEKALQAGVVLFLSKPFKNIFHTFDQAILSISSDTTLLNT